MCLSVRQSLICIDGAWLGDCLVGYTFGRQLRVVLFEGFEGSEGLKIHENQLPNRLKIASQNHADSRLIFYKFSLDFWSQMGPLWGLIFRKKMFEI